MTRIDVDRLMAAIHDTRGWDESNETEREFAERVATAYNRNPLVGKVSPKTQVRAPSENYTGGWVGTPEEVA